LREATSLPHTQPVLVPLSITTRASPNHGFGSFPKTLLTILQDQLWNEASTPKSYSPRKPDTPWQNQEAAPPMTFLSFEVYPCPSQVPETRHPSLIPANTKRNECDTRDCPDQAASHLASRTKNTQTKSSQLRKANRALPRSEDLTPKTQAP